MHACFDVFIIIIITIIIINVEAEFPKQNDASLVFSHINPCGCGDSAVKLWRSEGI